MKKGQCPYEKASLVPRFPAYSSLTGTVSHGHLDPQGYQGRAAVIVKSISKFHLIVELCKLPCNLDIGTSLLMSKLIISNGAMHL